MYGTQSKKTTHSYTRTCTLQFNYFLVFFFFFINLNTVNSSVLSWVVLGCFYNVVIHQRKTNYHKTARAFKEKKDYPEYSESIFRVHLKRKTYKSTLNQLHSIRQWKIYYISGFFLSKSEIKMDSALRYKMAKEVSQNRWKRLWNAFALDCLVFRGGAFLQHRYVYFIAI